MATQRNEDLPIMKINTCELKNPDNILKIIKIVFNFIILICISSNTTFGALSYGTWINFCASFTTIFGGIFLIAILTNLIYYLPGPWVMINIFYSALTILMFLAGCIVAGLSVPNGYAIAALVFLLANLIISIFELSFSIRYSRKVGWFYYITKSIDMQQTGNSFEPTNYYSGSRSRSSFIGDNQESQQPPVFSITPESRESRTRPSISSERENSGNMVNLANTYEPQNGSNASKSYESEGHGSRY